MNSRISSGQVPAMQTDPIMWSDGSTVWLFGGGVLQSMHYICSFSLLSFISSLATSGSYTYAGNADLWKFNISSSMWEKVQTPGAFPRARYDLYLIISLLFIIFLLL